jgi:EAL domain-containing protein (putative c-di-GMP-specific phosphodiesterase class I)
MKAGVATAAPAVSSVAYQEVVGALRLEHELAQAIHQEDFELHYQPMVDLQQGRIAGFEALVRWRHRERGLIPPMLFIPAAESSGLIAPLGRWCLKEACMAQQRLAGGLPDGHSCRGSLFVSVNVTSRDLADPAFVPYLDSVIDETGVDPKQIKLEITETLLMQEPEVACETLNRCRIKGLSIAIDDFGTGYSSLSYLHRFPIDTLKIDRGFIAAMSEDEANRGIVQTIITLGSQLRKPVVAEGIETLEQATSLRDMGATFGQGYYFSKPCDEATAKELLLDWKSDAMTAPGLRAAV